MNRSACMTVQAFTTGFVAFLSEKLEVTFSLMTLLFFLMAVDYFSGMGASAVEALKHPNDKNYGWSSRKGTIGILKKAGYCFVIVVAIGIDYILSAAVGQMGSSLPINVKLSLLVMVWYLLNEALSIIENAGRMGAPIPEWLMCYIAILKNKIDAQNETTKTDL